MSLTHSPITSVADVANDFDSWIASSNSKNQFDGDERLIVNFYMAPVIDVAATERLLADALEADLTGATYDGPQGKVFKDVPFIKIEVPGDKLNINEREANDFDLKVRFKDRYAKWLAGREDVGTPLSVLGFPPSKVAEYAAQNVKTVENLAALGDSYATRLMGGIGAVRLAKQYIDMLNAKAGEAREAARDAKVDAIVESNAKLAEQNEALLAQLAALKAGKVKA